MDNFDKNRHILEQWANVAKFDPNQTSFNLSSINYAFHQCGEVISRLNTEIDPSGTLAIIYLKSQYQHILKKYTISVLDAISDRSYLSPYARLWEELQSTYVIQLETHLNSIVYQLIDSVLDVKQLSSNFDINVSDVISDIVEMLPQLKLDLYAGAEIKDINHVDSNIQVYNTLAECLLAISNSLDGVYICYISEYQTSSGYFNVIIKSNNTLIGCHDRIDESYVGQHTNSRNGRWQEHKFTDIFPYTSILKFSSHDYLGYATKHEVTSYDVHIKDLDHESIVKLMLSIHLLKRKYENTVISADKYVIVDTLIATNNHIITSLQSHSNHIIQTSDTTLALINSQNFSVDFNSSDVISGKLSSKFNHSKDKNNYRESGCFTNANQILVDTFGSGFILDKSKLLYRTEDLQLIDNSESSTIAAEFVGSPKVFELESYRQSRKQLRDYIIQQMSIEYNNFGGINGVKSWFNSALKTNMHKLMKLAVKYYVDIQSGAVNNTEYSPFCTPVSKHLIVFVTEEHPRNFGISCVIPNNSDLRCCITGAKCNVFMIFQPCYYEVLEDLFGDIPKILKGWSVSGDSIMQVGNPLLDSTDPVGFIESPFYWRSASKSEYQELFPGCESFPFVFAVGFSKRGLNKAIKDITIIDNLEATL